MEPMTFTVGGEEYVFRLPLMKDYVRINKQLPLLVTDDTDDTDDERDAFTKMAEDPDRLVRFLERVDAMLCVVSLKPKLVEAYDLEPADGVRSVQSIRDQDKTHIYLCLIGESGYNDAAAVEIGPLSEADPRSSGSTPSVNGTASAPAGSSAG